MLFGRHTSVPFSPEPHGSSTSNIYSLLTRKGNSIFYSRPARTVSYRDNPQKKRSQYTPQHTRTFQRKTEIETSSMFSYFVSLQLPVRTVFPVSNTFYFSLSLPLNITIQPIFPSSRGKKEPLLCNG